jgi:hypothetical protein
LRGSSREITGEITGRSPEITGDHRRSPEITGDHREFREFREV